ncbi:MAG: TrkA family potassium uptake protein [Nitrospirae bacterium]|nr:TrkA family potassium uptake protein [Nitrospirota bacterium]
MKKQFAVIGLGRFGSSVAIALAESGCEVIAIDNDEEKVKNISDLVTYALVLDAIDEKALRSAGVQNVDVAIVSIGENIEANILVVMLLKELRLKQIVAKAVTQLHGKVLEHLAVDKIVFPERDMAIRIAHGLVRPGIVDLLELSPEYSIIEMPAPAVFVGKSLLENQLRLKYGVNLIAIKRMRSDKGVQRETWNVNPLPTDVINEGDLLVTIGLNKDLERLGKE